MPADEQLRLLLIEPNPVEARLLQELLQEPADSGMAVFLADSPATASSLLAQQTFDLALVDAVTPEGQQLTLFHSLRAAPAPPPVILLIEHPDPVLLHQATGEGVQDYLLKREVDSASLRTTIRHVVLRARLHRQAARASSAAIGEGIDALTGLPGPELLLECLDYEGQRAQRYAQNMALMLIEVAELDQGGEHGGGAVDEQVRAAVLPVLAERLKNVLRASDTTGRYGEGFACILNDLSELEDIHVIIRKVETALSAPVSFRERLFPLSIKAGLALYPGDSGDVRELMQCAATALEAARRKEGSCAEIFNPQVRMPDLDRFKVADAVRFALEKKELQLRLQPVLSLPEQQIVAAEAQLYWAHGDYAEIGSRDILFLAELAGLSQPLEEWMLRQACELLGQLPPQAADMKIRLPLPSGIFRNTGFPGLLRAILAETGQEAGRLQLTVPLSAIMQAPEKAQAILRQLAEIGAGLLLDDFGGSRSSMQILRQAPIDGLLIAESLVKRIAIDAESASTVKTIIAMSQALHLDLTARGVDSPAQESLLAGWQCPAVQGSHYAPPADLATFLALPLWHTETARKDAPRQADGEDVAQRIRALLGSVNQLPPMSGTAHALLELRNRPEAGIEELDAIIEQDPAIAAQIIRYANAPFFGNQGQIKTIKQAVMTALGFEGALNMALGMAVAGSLQGGSGGDRGFDRAAFWRHAVYAAALSAAIARAARLDGVQPGTAWLAGLLQNIGYLVLGRDFQPEMERLRAERRQHPELLATELEEQVLGLSHAEVGLHLLRGWQLPGEIVTAVFEHHNVSYVGEHAAYANIVLLANRLLAQQGIGDEPLGLMPLGILQMLSLNEEQLEKITREILDSREGLDTMGQHLAA